jgi:hypothetical protein
MGRRRLTLLERVMDASFRPRHHAELLADDLLRAQPPEGTPPKVRGPWKLARHAQLDYQGAASAAERREAAFAFQAAVEQFAEARAGAFTLAQRLHATIGPLATPPVGLGVSRTAWRRVQREWDKWDAAHGAAWRLLNGPSVDADPKVKVREGEEVPPPPGFDLLVA